MRQSDKKTIIAVCYDKLESLTFLTERERKMLKERFLPNGSINRSHESLAEQFGTSSANICRIVEKCVGEIVEHMRLENERKVAESKAALTRREFLGSERTIQAAEDARVVEEEIMEHHRGTPAVARKQPYDGEGFETLNIVLAATMMARGFQLGDILEPLAGGHKKRILISISPEDARDIMNEWLAGEAMVEATRFHACLQSLKSALYTRYNVTGTHMRPVSRM
jgi:hypothetical protein